VTIELEEPRPPAPPDALAETERRLAELGRPLPPAYRAFLAEQDGGRPVRNTFAFAQGDREQSSRVASFFGVLAAPDGDLVEAAELGGDLPEGLVAIAGDEFGNYVCLDADGRVRFWDHEEEYGNVYEVAPDLETFVDGLTEPELPPAAPEPQRSGWRRMFGR
jgi:hypothetical protein